MAEPLSQFRHQQGWRITNIGFRKCLYSTQKFHSDPERRFAGLIESDKDVLKWVKPAPGNFQIGLRDGSQYEPDFVIETSDCRYLAEVKRRDLMASKDVQAKADAAKVWCQHASEFTKTTDKKPWLYLLVPDDVIKENFGLAGLSKLLK